MPRTVELLFWWVLLASVVTFVVFWVDKRRARGAGRTRPRRVRERTLHLLSAAGGWPGAIVAIAVLRHKNRKPTFWLVTVAIAVVEALLVGLWLSRP